MSIKKYKNTVLFGLKFSIEWYNFYFHLSIFHKFVQKVPATPNLPAQNKCEMVCLEIKS
jgi:hypothetical protein